MAISEVKICNMALTKLGADTIMALTDDSDNARACNMMYEALRDEILRGYPWNFAINRATLAQLTAAPAYGYDHAYQLPSSPYCLRVLELYEERDSGSDWHVEGRTLVTDADTARIKYVQRVTDPTYFDAAFTEAFAARLAAEMALAITGSKTMAEAMAAVYEEKISQARLLDAIEGHADEDDKPVEDDGSWISSR